MCHLIQIQIFCLYSRWVGDGEVVKRGGGRKLASVKIPFYPFKPENIGAQLNMTFLNVFRGSKTV